MRLETRLSFLVFSFSALIGACANTPAPAPHRANASRRPADVDAARLRGADRDRDNWLTHGRTYDEQRFSPLAQIDTQQRRTLGLAWFARPRHESRAGSDAAGRRRRDVLDQRVEQGVQRSTRATGKLLWQLRSRRCRATRASRPAATSSTAASRSWNGKVFVGTLDGRLIALDAATRQAGVVGASPSIRSKRYTITGAPRVIKGKVLDRQRRRRVSACAATSPRTTPRPASWSGASTPCPATRRSGVRERDAGAWPRRPGTASGGSSAAAARSGTRWPTTRSSTCSTSASATARPWNQQHPQPGRRRQPVPRRRSSRSSPTPASTSGTTRRRPARRGTTPRRSTIILADLTIGGQPRKVLMQAPKNGFFYVLDRTTGELISAEPFAPVNWATGVDLKTGRPVENPGRALRRDRQAVRSSTPRPARRAQLAADVVQPADAASSTSRRRTSRSAYADDKNFKRRPDRATTSASTSTPPRLPADEQSQSADAWRWCRAL